MELNKKKKKKPKEEKKKISKKIVWWNWKRKKIKKSLKKYKTVIGTTALIQLNDSKRTIYKI